MNPSVQRDQNVRPLLSHIDYVRGFSWYMSKREEETPTRSFASEAFGLWDWPRRHANVPAENSLEERLRFRARVRYVAMIRARAQLLVSRRGENLTRLPKAVDQRTGMRLAEPESACIFFLSL